MIRWPKAIAKKITEHVGVLAFYDYPAEHWIYLRTTTPIGRPSPPSGCVSASPRDPLAGRRSREGVQAHRVRTSPLIGRALIDVTGMDSAQANACR